MLFARGGQDSYRGTRPWHGFMEVSLRITRNVFSGWMGLFVQLLVMMILTPLVLGELGGTRYGVWALLTTITGYYGLLDAGARVTIARIIACYGAVGNWQQMNRLASAGLATLLACAAFLMLLTVICAASAEYVLHLPGELASEFRWCVLAVGTSVAIQFCLFVHSAALGARQRYDLVTASQVAIQMVYACGVPLVLFTGGGLVALSLWLSATNVLSYVLRWHLARQILPELALSLRLVDRAGLAEFAHFGAWQFLVNLGQRIIGYSDAIVIAVVLNAAAVAPFYLASRVARYFIQIFMPVGVVLFPAMVHLDTVGTAEQIRRMYLRGSRLLWILSIGLGFFAGMWAADFFSLWVGERQAGFDGRVSDLFHILLIAAVVTAPQQMSLPAYLALGRQRLLAALLMAEAAINVALSLVLVQEFGLAGLAWGTCVPALIFQGVIHPVSTCRMVGVDVGAYLKSAMGRPIAYASVLAALSLLRPEGLVHSWPALFFAGACTGVVFAAAATVVGLDGDDRKRFVFAPLRQGLSTAKDYMRVTPRARKRFEADTAGGAASPVEAETYDPRATAESGHYGRETTSGRSTGGAIARESAVSTAAARD